MNLTTLSKRLDKLTDDGAAERFQAAWDRFCDSQGQPRIHVARTACIEELLKLYRAESEAAATTPLPE